MAVRKSITELSRQLQGKIDKAGEFWLDKQPARLGNYARTVNVPNKSGIVYARLGPDGTGPVVQVLNNVAPAIFNWSVSVGRDKSQPHVYKVLETRWVYNLRDTLAGFLAFHHKQHEFPNPDTVFIYRDQFLPLLVYPAGGMEVQLFGDVIYTIEMDNPLRVADTLIDLTSYIPASGANYVTLEVDPTGVLNYIVGDTYSSYEAVALTAPIPKPTEGSIPIAAFIMFAGQTSVRRDLQRRDIVDLRTFVGSGGDIGATWGSIIGTLSDQLDLQAALDAKMAATADYTVISTNDAATDVTGAELEELTDGSETTLHSHEVAVHRALKIVMQPDLIDPPVPVLTPEGDDYVYYEVEI